MCSRRSIVALAVMIAAVTAIAADPRDTQVTIAEDDRRPTSAAAVIAIDEYASLRRQFRMTRCNMLCTYADDVRQMIMMEQAAIAFDEYLSNVTSVKRTQEFLDDVEARTNRIESSFRILAVKEHQCAECTSELRDMGDRPLPPP